MKTLLALFFTIGSAYAAQVPDYTVKIGLDPASKVPRWLVEGIPPVNFHFNLKAGAKVSVKGKRATFTPVIETESRLGFSSSSMELKEGDSLETAFYLCDQAKTLCVRKTLSLPMRVNSSLTHFESQNPTVKEKPRPKPAQKQKDSHGFFLNDIEGAQSEARRSQKPLLIDFFGIWCPPCNLYSETVFPDPRFQKIAKKFVLLKLDADQEVSFPLKSKFKVGGYPTLIIADASGAELREISRIVGFFPTLELIAKLQSSFRLGGETLEGRITRLREEYLRSLREKSEVSLEQKNPDSAWVAIREGLLLEPKDSDLILDKIRATVLKGEESSWGTEQEAVFQALIESRSRQRSALLLKAVGVILDSDVKAPISWIQQSELLLAELQARVDPLTLSVSGTECLLPDLAAYRIERAEILQDGKEQKAQRTAAIEGYLKLIALHPKVDSRGLNLELAALLVEEGRTAEAAAIYERFMKRHPREFTFYYAAAKMYLGMKDLKRARDLAEKSVEFGYGDHLIRAMDRLVTVMRAQGEEALALKRGDEFLNKAQSEVDSKLKVRTGRYLTQLQKNLDAIRKEIKK